MCSHTHTHMNMGTQVPWCLCGDQRMSRRSPSTVWVLQIKLRLSGLQQAHLPALCLWKFDDFAFNSMTYWKLIISESIKLMLRFITMPAHVKLPQCHLLNIIHFVELICTFVKTFGDFPGLSLLLQWPKYLLLILCILCILPQSPVYDFCPHCCLSLWYFHLLCYLVHLTKERTEALQHPLNVWDQCTASPAWPLFSKICSLCNSAYANLVQCHIHQEASYSLERFLQI